jgi:2-succinyl-5-enolpyruvyl-6-hydroxy-3-cyclohexene-1-carboxylate synthase
MEQGFEELENMINNPIVSDKVSELKNLILDYDKWAVEQEAFARSEYLRGFDEGVNDG